MISGILVIIEIKLNFTYIIRHRGMEQLVARRAHNPKVVGSSPTPATKKTPEVRFRGFFHFQNSIINKYVL